MSKWVYPSALLWLVDGDAVPDGCTDLIKRRTRHLVLKWSSLERAKQLDANFLFPAGTAKVCCKWTKKDCYSRNECQNLLRQTSQFSKSRLDYTFCLIKVNSEVKTLVSLMFSILVVSTYQRVGRLWDTICTYVALIAFLLYDRLFKSGILQFQNKTESLKWRWSWKQSLLFRIGMSNPIVNSCAAIG